MKKPHVLDKDKEKFQRFLGWASPYTSGTYITKLRRALKSFRLCDRWIEFMYCDQVHGPHLVQGILSPELYRYGDLRDFDILLRDVHINGKPFIDERRINKLWCSRFSARRIWNENHERW